MPSKECVYCRRLVGVLRKGYCGACYARIARNGTPEYEQVNRRTGQTNCSFCGGNGPIVKGLCKPCYYRQKKTGELEYQKVPRLCSAVGCNSVMKTHGYCDRHWTRILRNGSPDDPRPRGSKGSHPQYESWCWIKRNAKKTSGLDARWSVFWNFVDDVGEPPSPLHRLYKADSDRPYGPGNFVWKERVLGEVDAMERAEYMRSWRRAFAIRNPDSLKRSYIKRYGITLDQYKEMLSVQHNKCALCAKEETAVHHATREVRALAIDHCHKLGRVRALLCTNCNLLIGNSMDDPALLRKAAAYLEFHQSRFACDSGFLPSARP